MDKSRRRVFRYLAIMSGLPFLAGVASRGARSQTMESVGIIENLLDENVGLCELGRCYFECGYRPENLVDRLLSNLKERGNLVGLNLSPGQVLNDLVDQDFSSGSVLNIDGWVLSRSEVALGLLAFLLEHPDWRQEWT